MNHDLTLAQLAAIHNADVARVEYHSQAADILRLEVQLRRGEGFPLPWQYGDAVRLLGYGGEVLFCGTCAPPNYDAMTNRWSVEVRSAWADLNRTPLVTRDKDGNLRPANAASQSAPAVRVDWKEYDPDNPLADSNGMVKKVKYVLPGEEDALLEAHTGATSYTAAVKGLSLADSVVTRCAGFPSGSAGAVSNLNAIVPAVGSNGSSTCGALIRAALEHVPGSVTWSDYADGGKLNAALAGSLPSLCLNMATGEIAGLGQTGGVTQYSLRRRPDLVPPGVIIFYGTKLHACVPANLDPSLPGVIVVTVQPLQCGTGAVALDENGGLDAAATAAVQEATNKYMRVRGIALPTSGVVAAGRFWSQLFPWLAPYQSALEVDAPVIKKLTQQEAYPEADDMASSGVGAIAEASAIRNYSTACGYLMTEGVFTTAKRTGIKFCKGSVTQRVWLENPGSLNVESAQETGRHFPGYGTHNGQERMFVDFQLTGIFIDRKGYVYRTADNEEVPEEEAEEEEGGGQSQQEQEQEAEEERQRAEDAKQAELEYTKRCAEDYYSAVSGERPELHVTLFRPDFWPGALMGKTLSLANCHPLHAGVATPVLGVTWNLITGEVEVEGGSGAEANFNDMLSVRRALQAAADAAMAPLMGEQNFEDTYGENQEEDPEEPEEPEDPEEPEETDTEGQKVQPNISATASAGAGGQVRQPFSIFQENGSWYMQGGYVPVHNGPPIWVDTQGVPYREGRKYSVQPRYSRTTNTWSVKVRYYDPPSSGS